MDVGSLIIKLGKTWIVGAEVRELGWTYGKGPNKTGEELVGVKLSLVLSM